MLATGKPSAYAVVPAPGFLNAAAALCTAPAPKREGHAGELRESAEFGARSSEQLIERLFACSDPHQDYAHICCADIAPVKVKAGRRQALASDGHSSIPDDSATPLGGVRTQA